MGISDMQEKHACESEDIAAAYDRLDELANTEGSLSRELRRLRNQSQLLEKQVLRLGDTACQNQVQVEEAEQSHKKLREETEAEERCAEIIHWKLQVTECQISEKASRLRSSRGPVGASVSSSRVVRSQGIDAGGSSDSTGVGHG